VKRACRRCPRASPPLSHLAVVARPGIAGPANVTPWTRALAVDNQCECLPGFEWASPDPSDTNCVRPTVLSGCHLFAQDSNQTYLGARGGCYDANSLCNKFGTYGSPYATDSIFNEYGNFGSEFAPYSASNPYTQSPPILVCNGTPSGCVTVNTFACAGSAIVNPATLCSCP
jgi:hypothetical protein